MPLWQWINSTPPYAEEAKLETEQIQETLSKFKQLVPEGFVELGQPKKYWGSTEGLDKTLCERYTFKHEGKTITLDITQELSDELELNLKENFCIRKEMLLSSHPVEEGGITINNEEEIFLKKSFAVENLEEDIDRLIKKIEKLEVENKELKNELEKEKFWWDKWINSNEEDSKQEYKQYRSLNLDPSNQLIGIEFVPQGSCYQSITSYSDKPFLEWRTNRKNNIVNIIKKLSEYYKNK